VYYSQSKSAEFEDEKELENLDQLIGSAYLKTETEIKSTQNRLRLLQWVSWSISILIIVTVMHKDLISFFTELLIRNHGLLRYY